MLWLREHSNLENWDGKATCKLQHRHNDTVAYQNWLKKNSKKLKEFSFHSSEGCIGSYCWDAYKGVNMVLKIFAYSQDKTYLRFLMSLAYFHSHEYYSRKSIQESRNQLLVKIESKWVDNFPVSTNWFWNTSKLFHTFQKWQNWKNLVSTLIIIQGLLTDGILGKETAF